MTLPNIALTGLMRSGKDAVADYLTQNYGYTRFAFGDVLKADFHRRYTEIPRDPKPRVGYQAHGQLMRELVREDIWVDACFDEIRYSRGCFVTGDDNQRAVISDLRQPNELTRCLAESYVIIRVAAPESVRIDRAIKSSDTFNLRDLTHDTESHVSTFEVDFEIVNDGTLAELYAQIDAIMTQLTEGVTAN
jgi:dephospho-CoA kinase